MKHSLSVSWQTGETEQLARAFADKYGYALMEHEADGLQLVFSPQGPYLVGATWKKPFQVDYTSKSLRFRLKRAQHEQLIKACAYKGKQFRILDATAGFGRDALLLASIACELHLLERSPVMHLLLEDGLKRARTVPELQPILANIKSLRLNDAQEALMADTNAYDVIYLDPMFDSKQGIKALAKKEMQMAQSVLANDAPNTRLLSLSLSRAPRVVVKRARLSPYLENQVPHHSLNGQSNRFDIYLSPLVSR